MGVINCCKCNAEIPEGSKFCMNCGAKQNVQEVEKLIDLVDEKLSDTNCSFSDSGRLKCKNWIDEFGFDEVCEAVEISIRQYLKFDQDGEVVKSSADAVFNKIPGICANRKKAKEQPYIADALKMYNYANKAYRLSGWLINDYKTHIERILYLLYTKDANSYPQTSEDFFWQIKKLDDKYDFYYTMDGIIKRLEEGGEL